LIFLLAGRLFNNDTNGETGCHTTNLLNARIFINNNQQQQQQQYLRPLHKKNRLISG